LGDRQLVRFGVSGRCRSLSSLLNMPADGWLFQHVEYQRGTNRSPLFPVMTERDQTVLNFLDGFVGQHDCELRCAAVGWVGHIETMELRCCCIVIPSSYNQRREATRESRQGVLR
jgi:hypothetical protein